jgi:hypothetical protein
MQNEKTGLKELAGLFIRLGLTAFGGQTPLWAMSYNSYDYPARLFSGIFLDFPLILS